MRSLNHKQVVIFSVLLPISLNCFALTDDDTEYLQLMSLLNEQTEVATKTKLNADYVPGLVSVLHGDDLLDRGARTVWEAMALVPGIDLSIEEIGRKQVIVRGVGKTYASVNVKLMVNGISLNSALSGIADPVFNMPLQQVERIEIIRGPGSAVHGEYAFSGVLNVITRKGEKSIVASVANDNGYTIGGTYHQHSDDGKWKMNLNMVVGGSDGATIDSGPDVIYQFDPSLTYSPGPTNEKSEYRSALFDMKYGDYDITLNWLEDGYGDHFGINHELPPPEKRIVSRYRIGVVEAGRAFNLSKSLTSHVLIGWQMSSEQKDDLFAYQWGPGAPDIIVDSSYAEERLYGTVGLTWKGMQNHTVFAELNSTTIQVTETSLKYNIDPLTFSPSTTMYEWGHLISEDKSRRIGSLTLQDEYSASEQITVTAGMRYDDYDDVGDSLNPRLAAVWRVDRNNTMKAQYAHAFRPSSFYELAGSVMGIEPAAIDTIELAYIYRAPKMLLRSVLFGSGIDNLVVFVDDAGASSFDSVQAEVRGAEFEVEKTVGNNLKLSGDLSYVDTYDASTGEQLPFSSNWLANFGVSYKIQPDLTSNIQLRYVGEKDRQVGDTRSALDAYSTVNATISYSNLVEGIKLQLGVNNILDEEVRYPALMNAYAGDYPRPGRGWWLELSSNF